jgi:DNA sulfur modification protein DndD
VIVLVSETQWRIELEQEVNPRVGKEYVLCLRTQKEMERHITLHNRAYEYIRHSIDSNERTEIVEVVQ